MENFLKTLKSYLNLIKQLLILKNCSIGKRETVRMACLLLYVLFFGILMGFVFDPDFRDHG